MAELFGRLKSTLAIPGGYSSMAIPTLAYYLITIHSVSDQLSYILLSSSLIHSPCRC